jgi:hypothetical protein
VEVWRSVWALVDGKVFSTMNLMRIHFERRYAADADTWWRQQLHMDPAALAAAGGGGGGSPIAAY